MPGERDLGTDEKVWGERRGVPLVDLGPMMLPSAFWEPDFDADEVSSCHLPVMFWLSEALRPRQILAIGSGSGVGTGYLGACQAVDRLALPARCRWIVPTESPSVLMSEPWLRKAFDFNGTRYARFSEIWLEALVGDDDWCPEERLIELVIIDARCPDIDLASVTRQLDPRLSARAVLAIIGIDSRESSTSNRAFVADLKKRYSHFCFPQGEGMAVMSIGVDVPPLVQRLIDYGKDDVGRIAVRDVFWRLGQACVLEVKCQELSKRTAWLFRKKEELKLEVSRRDELLREVDTEINEIRRGRLGSLYG